MKKVLEYISSYQKQFSEHPFFTRVKTADLLGPRSPFPACLTFWVMTFQDVLRINDARVTDPLFKHVARQHRLEDAGHDRWFLTDLTKLGVEPPTVAQLFDERHEVVRHASYALISEAYRATNDACRIVLLLTLESSGHVFFERMASYLERGGDQRKLMYFSRFHLNVEQSHKIFAEGMDDFLEEVELCPAVRDEAFLVVQRCHDAFCAMFDGIEAQMASAATSAEHASKAAA